MRSVALAVALLISSLTTAQAGILTADLEQVGVRLPAAAQVPTSSWWKDENGDILTLGQALAGRPALLIFADYTCRTLCGPILSFVVDALSKSELPPHDYRLVVLGIDPKDGPGEAAAMKQARISDELVASAATFLTAGESTIRETAEAVGYRFTYDAAHDQFAHPAAVLVLTADGRVNRVLSGLGISADDFRLALVEASEGRIGTLRDQVRLLCYGFDPSTGVYTLSIYRALAIASALTVIMLAGWLGWLSRRRHPLS
jgi:protein SCO1